jgi:ferredoxin
MAIPQLDPSNSKNPEGVLADRCYGCGRCVPTCPYGMIDTASYKVDADAIKELFETKQVNAIEIHTQYGHETAFDSLVKSVGEEVFANAKVIAVSLPDMGNKTIPYMEKLQSSFTSHPMWHTFTRSNALTDEHREGIDCAPAHGGVQIWQCDGRPMSGDIGRGTARAAVEFASDIIDQLEAIETIDDVYTRKRGGEGTIELFEGKQYVQLAGGTNDYSPVVAREENLAGRKGFGGYAFGGFARKRISKILSQLDEVRRHVVDECVMGIRMDIYVYVHALVNIFTGVPWDAY